MANGLGADRPSAWVPASIAATSSRLNQRASSSSVASTVISVLDALAKQPIISDDGNGQGWEA